MKNTVKKLATVVSVLFISMLAMGSLFSVVAYADEDAPPALEFPEGIFDEPPALDIPDEPEPTPEPEPEPETTATPVSTPAPTPTPPRATETGPGLLMYALPFAGLVLYRKLK